MTSEFDFIHDLRCLAFQGDQNQDGLNLEDDICIISQSSNGILIASKDIITEDTHFFKHDPLDLVIKKAIRTNISDITAKGAKLHGMMVGLMLPEHYRDDKNLKIIHHALAQDIEYYKLPLLGGDTVSSKNFSISITIFGSCPALPPLRKNAKAGDHIYVTGILGKSHAGLNIRLKQIKETGDNKHYLKDYLLPDPPYALGQALFPYMNASCDISDGLLQDLNHILKASHVGAEIDLDKIPYAMVTQNKAQDIEYAVTGGDDYQILFTSQHNPKIFKELAEKFNISITHIGEITENNRLSLSGNININKKCYNNF